MQKLPSLSSLGFAFKLLIVGIALWFLYNELFVKHNLNDLYNLLLAATDGTSLQQYLLPALILMLLNWSIEAFKWKILISKVENVSYYTAIEAVFAGVTVSFFTPNRVGEFAGRIFFLEKAERVQAALISILGSMSQLIITLLLGCISMIFFAFTFLDLDTYLLYLLIFLTAIFVFLILIVFFNINLLESIIARFGLSKKFTKLVSAFNLFSHVDLLKVLFLSLFRYLVFTTQFLLLLRLMQVETPIGATAMMISLTYLLMAIPAFALAEVGIRSVIAVKFIGLLSANETGIITASFLLYLINVAVPALIGAFYVFKLKFFRK